MRFGVLREPKAFCRGDFEVVATDLRLGLLSLRDDNSFVILFRNLKSLDWIDFLLCILFVFLFYVLQIT